MPPTKDSRTFIVSVLLDPNLHAGQ